MKNKVVKIISIAALALCAASNAYADNKQTNIRSTAPWYERFTFGSEFDTGINAWTPRGETKATIKVSPKSKWGVTFGLQEQPKRPDDIRKGTASAGAFYDFTKNLRIGGQVVLPEETINPIKKQKNEKDRGPSVKVESAFRF